MDIIVIGNNMGAGIKKARSVADNMKDKTIIIWNHYSQGEEEPYVDLGISNFTSRIKLKDAVLEILGIS